MKQVFPMDSRVTYDAEGRPSYDRAVSSKPLRSLIRKLFTTGVMPNPSNTCQVKAGGDGMTLIVSPGLAVLEGGLYLEDAARTLSVTAADPTFDRIDTVVLRWNENDAVRDCDLHVVAGVPARNPVRPALTREGSIYEIGLADIFVTKGVATITNEKITDTRMESARCGIVSSVSEFDTTTIYNQIQSDLAGFKTNEQAEFMTWFNKMKDQLTKDAAGKLQTEVDDVRGQICTNLLNPTAPTQTINGVTFTNNGDGTYTVNGTASARANIVIQGNTAVNVGYKFRVCGSNDVNIIIVYYKSNKFVRYFTCVNDITLQVPNDVNMISVELAVQEGTTVTNKVIKPMLTTDLSATYDDFVQYSGDGELNENVAEIYKVSDRVSYETHTNFLNPIAPTQTINGITFTNNGDGTYTLNGTASEAAVLNFAEFSDISIFENIKFIGCPVGGGLSRFRLFATCHNGSTPFKDYIDDGNGVILSNIPSETTSIRLRILVFPGYTTNNLLFKPMLTTDLSATYDDYVPYTGDSGRLNEDVANLVKGISGGISSITNSDIDTILNS